MDPAALLAFALEAAGLLEGVAAGEIRKRTRRLRVARVAARASAAGGSVISTRAIMKWLGREDSLRLLEARNDQTLAEAARSLSLVVKGATHEDRSANAHLVLAHVIKAYVEDLEPSATTRLTSSWVEATVVRDGTATREMLVAMEERLRSRLDGAESFETRLATLPPTVAEQAHQIRAYWPGVERIVDEVACAQDRKALLADWASTPPVWMAEAPATAHALLGSVAASYGLTVAGDYFLRSADAGGSPRAYLVARAAHCAEAAGDHEAARQLLTKVSDSHPYAGALLAAIDGRIPDAEKELSGWAANGPDEVVQKGHLEAALLRAKGDIAAAIASYERVASATGTSGGLVEAAALLLHRGVTRQTADRLSDARRALRLTLKARNARRIWGGDSIKPAELAIVASVMSGDTEGAYRLTRPEPDGDATREESASQRILEHAAMTAALTGRVSVATTLLADLEAPFARLAVIAVLADHGEIVDERYPSASAAWGEAWGAARGDSERLQAARGLADEGILAAGLDELETDYAGPVQEIRAIAAALAPGEDQVVRLRANAGSSPAIAVKLAEVHSQEGNFAEAARVLSGAAVRWSNPHLMIMSASEYRRAGQPKEALELAQRALRSGGREWPGIRDAHVLLVELYSAAGEWAQAAESARALLGLDDADVNARWALTKCLYAQREFEQAWYAMAGTGEICAPRTGDEAIVWVELCGRHAPREHLLDVLLQALPRWRDEERVFAAFVQVLLQTPGEPVVPSDEQKAAIRDAIGEFVERFPGSDYFRAITIDETDPLGSLPPELLRHDEGLDELHDGVVAGRFPLGVLASATGRTLTEVSLRRAAGVVLANVPSAPELAAGAFEGVSAVVTDPTVAHTLALLSRPTAEFLLGAVPELTITDALFHDALRAREALAQRSTLTLGWDSASDRPVVSGISESEAERLAERSVAIVELMSRMRRVPRVELRHLGELLSIDRDSWLSGLDLAIELKCPYWSDDRVMRGLAREFGVPAFGTVELMRWSELPHGGPSEQVVDVEFATLLGNYYVDLPFSPPAWRLSAAADAWRPRGSAAALRRTAPWGNPAETVQFVLDALREVHAVDADAVRDWVACAALGLGKIAGSRDAGQKNLALLGEAVFAQEWFGPQHAHFVLGGLRAAADELALEDVAEAALRGFYVKLVGAIGHNVGASYLRAMFSQAREEDQRLVARVILTHGLDITPGDEAL